MSKEERKIVSYHEVGHALISALQKNSEPVQKITIVPRTMGALGYVMHVPEDEKYLNSQNELHDMIVGLLGGRAAEEIVFDTVTTGASNDIEKATGIARSMITRYGMSKKFGLMGLETVESQYLEGRSSLNCADNTAAEIDTEVMNMLKECYEEALAMLRENRDVMDQIAVHLIEKETITGKEFMKIYREAKGLPEPEEKKEEIAVKEKSVLTEETGETEKKEEVHIPAQGGFPAQAQQSAYTAQQPQKPWSMPPAYDWNPEAKAQGQEAVQPYQNLNPQQRNQDAQPQNGLAPQSQPPHCTDTDGQNPQEMDSQNTIAQQYFAPQVQDTVSSPNPQPEETAQPPYTGAQPEETAQPQTQNPQYRQYQLQYPQQNTALPEDNGSNQETSRFGALWDRTVNGDRNNNSHNHENRW